MTSHSRKARICATREAQGYVAGDGVRLAFGYWPGYGTPLVALHGITGSYVTFAGIANYLAGRRALFAVDLRGRGLSDKPTGPYGMAQHAADVACAMRAMGMGATIILGHSMGGFVATALAETAPELVTALVLIDGGCATSTPGSHESLDAGLSARIDQLRKTYISREAYLQFWHRQPHFPPSIWSRWVEEFLNYEIEGEPPALHPRASEDAVRADVKDAMHREQIIERCRKLRVPVMLLRAVEGFVPGSPPLYPNTSMGEIRACVPQLEDHLIPDSTHYSMILGNRGAMASADLIEDFAAHYLHQPENSWALIPSK